MKIVEFFDVRWLEENETDVRIGPDWLFDYTSMFKSFNVFSNNLFGCCSVSKTVVEDDNEEVIYRPPVVSSKTPSVDSPVPSNSSDSQSKENNPDADSTPLTPDEREVMSRDASVDSKTFMKLLFPDPIVNELVASSTSDPRPSEVDQSANDEFVNIHNLLVSINDISQELPVG